MDRQRGAGYRGRGKGVGGSRVRRWCGRRVGGEGLRLLRGGRQGRTREEERQPTDAWPPRELPAGGPRSRGFAQRQPTGGRPPREGSGWEPGSAALGPEWACPHRATVCGVNGRSSQARYHPSPRGVAQPGSAPALGAGGRRFESGRPDGSCLSWLGSGSSSNFAREPQGSTRAQRTPGPISPGVTVRSSRGMCCADRVFGERLAQRLRMCFQCLATPSPAPHPPRGLRNSPRSPSCSTTRRFMNNRG